MNLPRVEPQPARAPAVRRTFLCADVDSFTPITEELGDYGSLALIRAVEDVVREAVDRYDGELLEVCGDGFLLAFEEVRAATAAGFAIAHGMEALRCAAERPRVTMRMAVHAGDVLIDRGRYFGRTIVAAFRLLERAGPGDLLLSTKSARELLGLECDSGRVPAWEHFVPKGLSEKLEYLRLEPAEVEVALESAAGVRLASR